MSYDKLAHHTARFTKRPRGYAKYDGGGCPVSANTRVQTLHETDEGFAIGPYSLAGNPRFDWWTDTKPESGAIVGWKLDERAPD